MNPFLAAADPMEEVFPQHLFTIPILHLDFTNQMLMTLVAAGLMLCIFPALFSYANAKVPGGARNFFESILEYLRLEVFRPALKEHADRFVPFLWTLFFFILFSNLLGQIPVNECCTMVAHWFGSRHEFKFWGTATGTPITTGALAIAAFFLIHVSGVTEIARALIHGTYGHHGPDEHHAAGVQHEPHMRGDALPTDVPGDLGALTNPSAHYGDDRMAYPAVPGRIHDHDAEPHMNPVLAVLIAVPLYLWNFAPHPFRPAPGDGGIKAIGMWVADVLMWGFLLVLELIGAAIKPFSLMIRLFANMIGGHIVLSALILLIPLAAGLASEVLYGIPITLLSLVVRTLELFVAFLQAYIFTFLVTLFIASAVAPEH